MESHQNCVTFAEFIRGNLRGLQEFSARHQYARGQTVYCMGDWADEIYRIDAGRVKIVRLSPDGQQKILSIYEAGDFFGELCICGGVKRSEQAVALEPLQVTSFQVKGLVRVLRKQPEMVLELLLLMCARLRESHDHIATLAFDNVPRRLVREILRLSRAPGARVDDNGVHLGVNLSHEELAHLVGTSREMITIVMNQFRQQGLVDYTRRHILAHPDRMEEYLRQS